VLSKKKFPTESKGLPTSPHHYPHPEQKRAKSVAQVVVNLPSKCEALSSNPSAAKKQKKRKKLTNRMQKHIKIIIIIYHKQVKSILA
jgi:hypothetical protein